MIHGGGFGGVEGLLCAGIIQIERHSEAADVEIGYIAFEQGVVERDAFRDEEGVDVVMAGNLEEAVLLAQTVVEGDGGVHQSALDGTQLLVEALQLLELEGLHLGGAR